MDSGDRGQLALAIQRDPADFDLPPDAKKGDPQIIRP